ncbi:hypothetical protein A4S05_28710 [Nostoc sp. KVJ20]|uniref:hypothetical protein n=1 Tax=Nostoc sp. KVJ20 TaxID=457944 RepID=UPI00083E4FF5|nr:hypothetical protein [Nostoc sp. KVJ20]ODH01495.1 hypothetical protein A4S05_28710 [Nostoc sp. KVJ20]
MNEFGLSFEWAIVLFSYQYHLAQTDIVYERDLSQKYLKQRWLKNWTESIQNFLLSQANENEYNEQDIVLFTDLSNLKIKTQELISNQEDFKVPYLILLGVSLFVIYSPLGTDEDEQYKKIKLCEVFRSSIIQTLELYAEALKVEKAYVKRFKSSYKKFIDDLKEKQSPINIMLGGLLGAVLLAVAAAFAMPFVVAVLAPILAPGLSGAAAVSAVLAALGGGAIAVGGFGMAGGVVVIVGGGAILGASAGTGIGALFAQSPELVIPESAKFLVVFSEIILSQKSISRQEIVSTARKLIQQIRDTIRSYEDRVFELNINTDQNKQEINNLNKVIRYLNKALEIAQKLLEKFLRNNS